MSSPRVTRRRALGIGLVLAAPALVGRAAAQDLVSPYDFGLSNESDGLDQTAAIQAAIDAASLAGKDVRLPGGEYTVQNLRFPGNIRLIGSSGATHLIGLDGATVGTVGSVASVTFDGISFSGGDAEHPVLLLDASDGITIRDCTFGGGGIGVAAYGATATIENCRFDELGDAAIHSVNSRGLFIRGNRISGCGNAGIRIWRDGSGHDGSVVTGNIVSRIDWRGGGNGQNGNGVNVYQADSVVVSDNVFTDCAFTAVRVNAGRNTQVRGNTCLNSGEVAIFSEFGFSGSVIADNIIDGAATGIDITNLDTGGYLATCTGNIVRNIFPSSAVNPDTRPVGIYAEADTVVANNAVENSPGIGIAVGWGPFVRNVSVSANVVTNCAIGIGVTVVDDPQVGRVNITANTIANAPSGAVAGMEWESVVTPDLERDAGRYPHVMVSGNVVA
ncbi:MAG TPA: TIGR03808 family TAT-translocated repetitive protein [Devosia sp.]|nr:TIGR03808 family TAT-translocated repetitive protein [Devosia sp.]